MGRELAPVRRSLLARPQKLGFLPTLWFWNDWEAQRLLLPFVFMTAPALLLINVLQMWLRLEAWVSISVNFVVPFLTMGLVERYVRAQAQRRSVAGIADAASLPAPTSNGDHDAAGGDAARP